MEGEKEASATEHQGGEDHVVPVVGWMDVVDLGGVSALVIHFILGDLNDNGLVHVHIQLQLHLHLRWTISISDGVCTILNSISYSISNSISNSISEVEDGV